MTSHFFHRLLIALIAVLLCRGTAPAANLGRDGATYHIAEPDALAEMEHRARETDWSDVMSREKTAEAVRAFRPPDLKKLPRAKNDGVFLADMSYTLEMDIPDGKGGILYSKGFVFNPLDYMPVYPFTLVVIDGDDALQVAWLKQSTYFKDIASKLLLVGGSAVELSREWDRPVFYAPLRLLERLRLAAAPSIVRQRGKMMEIREVAVETALIKKDRP